MLTKIYLLLIVDLRFDICTANLNCMSVEKKKKKRELLAEARPGLEPHGATVQQEEVH